MSLPKADGGRQDGNGMKVAGVERRYGFVGGKGSEG
jgi:hypothetical protein